MTWWRRYIGGESEIGARGDSGRSRAMNTECNADVVVDSRQVRSNCALPITIAL